MSEHLKIFWIIFLILASVLSNGCGERRFHDKKTSSAPVDSVVVEFNGANNKTVFEITQEKHRVDYEETSAGIFIKGIDSLKSDYHYGWLYSVNDTIPGIAADKFVTKDNDVIKWHYRRF